MEEIDLINSLEKISSKFPNRLLKIEGYLFRESLKEQLEVIIFRGFSSSTTHSIETDLEKQIIGFDHQFTRFKLFKAPLSNDSDDFIKENNNSFYFLNQENWI